MTADGTRSDSQQDVALISACGVAIATLVPVALYQLKRIRRLPDPPGRFFDSNRITASGTAHPLGVPDSLPGLASYTVTLVLAVVATRKGPGAPGGPDRKAVERLLGAKLLVDGSAALFNTVRQVISFGKLCSWCTGTALCTAAMVFAGRRHIRATVGPLLKEEAPSESREVV